MPDVAVAGSIEKTRAVGRDGVIALLEAGGIVDVMAVGVGEGVIDCAQARAMGLMSVSDVSPRPVVPT